MVIIKMADISKKIFFTEKILNVLLKLSPKETNEILNIKSYFWGKKKENIIFICQLI